MARSFQKDLNDPDAFHAFTEDVSAWYLSHAKLALAVAGAVIIAVGGYFGYGAWKSGIREQAGISLALASTPELLRKAADSFPGTKAGIIARLRLAALLWEKGDAKASEKEYRTLLGGGLRGMDLELAWRGLAGSLSMQGKCGEAVAIWKDILSKGSLLTAEDIYVSMGACLDQIGKPREALKSYETLVQKHPRSPFITPQLRVRMKRAGK